ncbi:MAG: FG-GAP repeat protein [Lysobacteraceae bacterium]
MFTRSGNTWTQQAKLVADDGVPNDYFGASVALDGNTALVGAYGDDVGVNSHQGSAYVFTRSGSTWTQQAKLVAGDGAITDRFGFSVTLDGDTALVGAYPDDVGAIGSAYVFTHSGTTWTQQAKLVAGDGAEGDAFGYSVALNRDTALVGAYGDDVGANSDQARPTFTRSGAAWTQQAKLVAGDGAEGDEFGTSVALDGDTTLVGATYDDVSSSNQGSAYVFTRSGKAWIQQTKLTAGDAAAGDLLGRSVALDGDTALVGAYTDDVGAISDQGSAYVFTHSGSTWTHQAELTAGNGATGDWFGDSVALDGDTALVGAYTDDVGANSDQGSAYVFTRSGNMWTQEAKLTADDGAAGDWFGYSVVLDGDTALVGATYDDVSSSNQGSAYVFTRSGTKWMQQAKLTAGDGATYDQFGWSVALDGDTALVGAYDAKVGVNSDQGSAYVFTRSDNTWAQEAKLTAGDGAAYDQFGWSVALDGETALVGAYADNVGANRDQGSAYVFTRSGTTWTQEAKLTAGDGAAGDFFGNSVALDVDTAILGAVGDTSDQGSAYVFTRIGTAWMQQAKLAAVDGTRYDQFGWSVALDGDTALVAAYAEKVGVNIGQGSAYVFTRSGSTWTQLAKLTAGDGAASDVFGRSVALSSTTVLVGAPYVDGLPPYGNPNEGAAYVFTIVLGMFANGFEEPVRAITVPRR